MLPYLAPQPIGPVGVYPFGLLVAAGIVAGAWMLAQLISAREEPLLLAATRQQTGSLP